VGSIELLDHLDAGPAVLGNLINDNLRIRRRMKTVAPIPMPPNSGRSAVRMMRWWADEFDRLREHGRVIKMSA
jgi:hypothetical protein